MFYNSDLSDHLASSSTIEAQPAIFAEINMNYAENIYLVGNYKNRPSEGLAIASKFIEETSTDNAQYFGYTDSSVAVDAGISDENTSVPLAFSSIDQKKNLLFSLEDCLGRFRPRSGINKAVFYGGMPGHFLHHTNQYMMGRPRYYMPSKTDTFKYWTSFRKQTVSSSNGALVEVERGIANKNKTDTTQWYIDDAAPFVVYKEAVPINRVIVKAQTHVGIYDLGKSYDGETIINDPLYDKADVVLNRSTPIDWKIEYLDPSDNWQTLRDMSDTVFPRDGYLELQYKLLNNEYRWTVVSEATSSETVFFSDLLNKDSLEIVNIRGLRVVINTMNRQDVTFDLIELSPRLAIDLTDMTIGYDVSKIASDLGVSGMPVGQLLASTGSITIADYDQAFSLNNTNSVVAKYIKKNIQLRFFEIIKNVPVGSSEQDFYVPVKTMYVDGFPEFDNAARTGTLQLRDLYFYFESMTMPELLINNVTLSYALAMIFDSIGYSNYVYKRSENDKEPIIPHFFVAPNKTVAQVLQELAIATQTAMFFDEYNNFVCMSKSYMLADSTDRDYSAPDITFYGSQDMSRSGIYDNKTSNVAALSNIIEVSSKNNETYNDGKITYTSRYIQKQYRETKMLEYADRERAWVYKPSLLWEVAPIEKTISVNEETGSGSYALSAAPLNSKLPATVPYVVNNAIVNNIIDLGEAAWTVSKYNGYFYSAGEIIRYDAVEYSISQPSQTDLISSSSNLVVGENTIIVSNPLTIQIGQKLSKISGAGNLGNGATVTAINGSTITVSVPHRTAGAIKFIGRSASTNYWISSQEEYQKYFAKLPFNGKMFITGRVRIFAEPYYEYVNNQLVMKNGAVRKHGRGEFGTEVQEHLVGLPSWTTDQDKIYGCQMDTDYLFGTSTYSGALSTLNNTSGLSNNISSVVKSTGRTSIIRNYLSSAYYSETDLNSVKSTAVGTVQSSALIMTGPQLNKPTWSISYVQKDFSDKKYTHMGARVRIVGVSENNNNTFQSPAGASDYYSVTPSSGTGTTTIRGASGGIGVFVNPASNTGYFFEIIALSEKNIGSYSEADNLFDAVFYRVGGTKKDSKAIPVKLWKGLAGILVDDGKYTGQYRMTGDDKITVYDLAVEYKIDGNSIKFFLYINNRLVGSVTDTDAIPSTLRKNGLTLFVRGQSKLMFENAYAITPNVSANYVNASETPLGAAASLNKEYESDAAFRKYSLPEAIQNTYLSKLSPLAPRGNDLYFEEFGTIMRECAYFNVRYDKAYPALASLIAPTFNRLKGYAVSGYIANAYSAEFMIFNITDSILSLDSSSGNYLKILGITFTQESAHNLTVDDYYKKQSDMSDPAIFRGELATDVLKNKETYVAIRNSRATYGKKEFNISSDYIQSQDAAEELMSWVTSKIMKPRLSVGMSVFANPTIQLGDIATIEYKTGDDNIDQLATPSTRFVVYNISYSRSADGPTMTVYLSQIAPGDDS